MPFWSCVGSSYLDCNHATKSDHLHLGPHNVVSALLRRIAARPFARRECLIVLGVCEDTLECHFRMVRCGFYGHNKVCLALVIAASFHFAGLVLPGYSEEDAHEFMIEQVLRCLQRSDSLWVGLRMAVTNPLSTVSPSSRSFGTCHFSRL